MTPPRKLLARLAGCRRGAAAVEAAFILPLLLLLILGIFEFGRMAWTRSALDFAVQEAARCAVVRPGQCGTTAQIQAYAAAKVAAVGVPASAFTVATGQACGVRVAAVHPYRAMSGRFLTDLFGRTTTLRAQVCRA